MITLTESQRHILLYAKNHYDPKLNFNGDEIRGLKYLISVLCGTTPDRVRDVWLWEVCVDILFDCMDKDRLRRFFSELMSLSGFRSIVSPQICPEHMILKALGYMAIIPVRDAEGNVLIELGKPDYNQFPLLEVV